MLKHPHHSCQSGLFQLNVHQRRSWDQRQYALQLKTLLTCKQVYQISGMSERYRFHFLNWPPTFSGLRDSLISDPNKVWTQEGLQDMIEKAQCKWFFSTYCLGEKKDGVFHTILDLKGLNWFLKTPFIHISLGLLDAIQPQDWFTYIVPSLYPLIRIAFQGLAFKFKILLFGLSLAPWVFSGGLVLPEGQKINMLIKLDSKYHTDGSALQQEGNRP